MDCRKCQHVVIGLVAGAAIPTIIFFMSVGAARRDVEENSAVRKFDVPDLRAAIVRVEEQTKRIPTIEADISTIERGVNDIAIMLARREAVAEAADDAQWLADAESNVSKMERLKDVEIWKAKHWQEATEAEMKN